jgi:hypothetical protein
MRFPDRRPGERRVAACEPGAVAGPWNGFPFCMRWEARTVGRLLAMVGMGLEILSADVPERGST